MAPTNPMQKRLEEQRFLRAISYVEQSARGLKILSTSELAHLNQMLTGEEADPWRDLPTSVLIPSGKTHHWSVLSNPVVTARDVIGEAQRMAGNQDVHEGAFHLYSQLVLQHLFKDANRRTAVLATLWLAVGHSHSLDALALADFPIGDLRDGGDVAKVKTKLKSLIAES